MLSLGDVLHQDTEDWIGQTGVQLFGNAIQLHPYQRGIVQAMDNPAMRQVSMMLASQSGKTTIMSTKLLRQIERAEASGMLVATREQDIARMMHSKVMPLAESSDRLKAVVGDAKKRAWNMRVGISYPPHFIYFATPGSDASLSGASAPLILADEVDRFAGAAGISHDKAVEVLDDLRQRQTDSNTIDRLLVLASTPENENESIIYQEFMAGNQCYWTVVCPGCGGISVLSISTWLYPEEKCIRCPDCGWLGGEAERRALTRAGYWQARRPEVQDHASFTMEELASLNSSLDEILYKQERYTDRKFRTLVEAKPWVPKLSRFEAADLDELLVDKRPWPAKSTQHTTCGVDVQQDRIEYAMVEHERGSPRWCVVEYGIIPRRGDSASMDGLIPAFDTLADKLFYQDGEQYGAPFYRRRSDRTFIDSGDGNEKREIIAAVKRTLQPKSPNNALYKTVFCSYGSGKPGGTWQEPQLARPVKERYVLAVDSIKEHVFSAIDKGTLSIVKDAVPDDFRQQLTAEVRVEVTSRAGPQQTRKYRWEKKEPDGRNEALDCVVYALAAYDSMVIEIHKGD